MNEVDKPKELTRCFIALSVNEECLKEIIRVQEILSGYKFVGKLIEPENLHLTLKFLGEVSEEKLEKIKLSLAKLKFEEFEGKLGEIGVFNFKGNPKIVQIKIGGKGVFDLQEKIDELLVECGYEKEKKFMSHLTIARLKYVHDKIGFGKYVSGIGVKDIKFKVDRIELIKSELRSPGPVYSVIEEYNCNPAENINNNGNLDL
ncbi:MAG: RNA 2',3'-cyclic phosphodiesterase [Nanoarchaeota archaeon]